ncbi:LysE family translocator [Nitrincola iocasae]|uniref:LysE family translocator n=1 Tax=Nitrincola iocasae TaxID=2614693 RepID=A0A5J6LAM8_9GAMM|nr:LysE family transporter [Nitrincola iocasae]QEW05669.1 LysE family translocator [Nitrincola iocasae]
MVDNLLFLWLAALPLMGSPGPATLSLAGLGSAFGFRQSLNYLYGIIMGTITVLLMIATGVTTLILAQPMMRVILSSIAGVYILFLAVKIATAPVGQVKRLSDNAPSFLPGFSLAIANPKAFAAIGAVYSSHTIVDNSLMADTICKLLALILVILSFSIAWLAFGATFSNLLRKPSIGRTANIIFAVMLILSVGSLWFVR